MPAGGCEGAAQNTVRKQPCLQFIFYWAWAATLNISHNGCSWFPSPRVVMLSQVALLGVVSEVGALDAYLVVQRGGDSDINVVKPLI